MTALPSTRKALPHTRGWLYYVQDAHRVGPCCGLQSRSFRRRVQGLDVRGKVLVRTNHRRPLCRGWIDCGLHKDHSRVVSCREP